MTETLTTYGRAVDAELTRHYLIQDQETGMPIALIAARSPAGALAHHTATTLTVRRATTSDVVACLRMGIQEQCAVSKASKEEA